MNIENIQKMWEKDSHINPDKYEEESTKIPQLHQRYMEHFNTFSLMKREKELELNQLRKEKWVYYKGKAPSSVYKFQPFDLKLTTSDEIRNSSNLFTLNRIEENRLLEDFNKVVLPSALGPVKIMLLSKFILFLTGELSFKEG